ncbi:hypothetical protein, partial [Leptolyngbya sp. Heron Island J]|uniref:hypothetical protein n=1 Tax=Leptolyngbya sp. Heron Island J TaxID=1385935 RepID=UPI0004CF44B0
PLLTADGIAQLNQELIKLTLVQSLTGPSLVEELGGPPRSAADVIETPEELTAPVPKAPVEEELETEDAEPALSAPSPQ